MLGYGSGSDFVVNHVARFTRETHSSTGVLFSAVPQDHGPVECPDDRRKAAGRTIKAAELSSAIFGGDGVKLPVELEV